MEKYKWIENIVNSTNGIMKVSPNEELFSKIQSKINDQKPVETYVKWLVAASIVVIITLNTTVLTQKRNPNKNNTGVADLVSTVNNQLY
jgi:hypothetical protein